MAKLDPKDPQNQPGNAPEVSEKDVKLGVYVFQPRNEQDEPVGEKKFLASNESAHVEAFLHAGYRAATEAETKEYVEKTKQANAKRRDLALGEGEKDDVK